MEPYETYAKFYDSTQGPRDASGYLHLLQKYNPDARTLLEIACGTGELLITFAKHYEVTGLDNSGAMLQRARLKLPDTTLHQQSMVGFNLSSQFDAIVCPYDSINHLLRFQDWGRTFRAAKGHLARGGVFVFDAHTEHNLERLAGAPPHVLTFGNHYMIMNVERGTGHVYNWDIKVFEQKIGSRYQLHQEVIQERAFPNGQVLDALRAIFPIVRVYDPRGWHRPKQSTKRLFYVCKLANR